MVLFSSFDPGEDLFGRPAEFTFAGVEEAALGVVQKSRLMIFYSDHGLPLLQLEDAVIDLELGGELFGLFVDVGLDVHLNINLPLNQSFHKFPDRSDWVAPDLAYNCIIFLCSSKRDGSSYQNAGLHKLWYPSIRDTSTWSKLGAHGEHGDVFLFSNVGAL